MNFLNHHYEVLDKLLEEGLAPYGITPENIQENQHRVAIMHGPPEWCHVEIDIWVDGQYAFSIRRKVAIVDKASGVVELDVSYEMFVKGEEK